MSKYKFISVKTAEKIHAAAMSVLLAAMVVTIFYQVVSRYIFNFSLVWAEELARGCFIWMVFMGLSYVERNDEPIKITILRDLMPCRVQSLMNQISMILSLVFCLICTFYGFERVAFLAESKQIAPGLQINMVWFYLAIPVGFLLTSIAYIIKIIVQINSLKTEGIPDRKGES